MDMDVKTILWPTDLSAHSRKAAPHVVSLAEKYGAKIYLLYVAVDLCAYFPAYGNYPSADEMQRFQSWEIEQAKKKMEGICAEDLSACPNVEIRLVSGSAAPEILKAAKELHADMIVLTGGEYGQQSDAVEPRLSHIVSRVLEASPVPVHVVR
ncbi:UspA domain-containing protein [Desulfovibrio sp. X2]|nr:UspA domain-containing protein [Desulfovibrio sp. X2]